LLLGLAGALLLNEVFRGRRLLLLLSILPMALSTYATAILWRYIYSQGIGFLNSLLQHLGLVDEGLTYITSSSAIFLVAIAHSWQMAPFGMSFFLAALQVIPPDMYRVARIDRLGPIGRFRHVTLPYLRGTIMATSVLFMIAAFKVFDIIYFLTTGGPGGASTTMTYHIYLQTFRAYNYGLGAALAYILLAVLMVLLVVYFTFYLRQRAGEGAR
jgi:ABC-type sugar transport system permease subunit